MGECPCRYCTYDTGRSPTCHATCEKYLKWDKEHKEELEEIQKKRQEERAFTRSIMTNAQRNRWRDEAL